MEYSSESVCVLMHPCVCVCVCLHDNSKSNQSRNLKFEYVVVYANISDMFDIVHCQIKVKVTVGLKTFSSFTTIQTDRAYNSTRKLGTN